MRERRAIPQPTFSAAICDAAKRDAAAGRAGAAVVGHAYRSGGHIAAPEHIADAAWRAIYQPRQRVSAQN